MTAETDCSAADVWRRMQFVQAIDSIDLAVAHQLEELQSGLFAPPGGGKWSDGWWLAIQMGQVPGSAFHRLRETDQIGLPAGKQIHLDIEVMATLLSLAEKAETTEESAELWKLSTEKAEAIRAALAELKRQILTPLDAAPSQPEEPEPAAAAEDGNDLIPDPAGGMLAWLCKDLPEESLPNDPAAIRKLELTVAKIRGKVERLDMRQDGSASDFPWPELKDVFAILGDEQRDAAIACERAWWHLGEANRERAGDCDEGTMDSHLDLAMKQFVGDGEVLWPEARYVDLIQQTAGWVRAKLEGRVVGWLERVLDDGKPKPPAYLGLRLEGNFLGRDGYETKVELTPKQTKAVSAMINARGDSIETKDMKDLLGSGADRIANMKQKVNPKLVKVGVKIAHRVWKLVDIADVPAKTNPRRKVSQKAEKTGKRNVPKKVQVRQ